MPGTKLVPEKITSPFQLMAAWFSMLVLISSVLLTAAVRISKPDWAAAYLVIFTSVVVFIVLGCVILMLTIFRPHLQDGKEYARWLKDKNAYSTVSFREALPVRRPRRIVAPSSNDKDAQKAHDVVVNIVATPQSLQLMRQLVASGFNARIYEGPDPDEEDNVLEKQEAIWVGSRVPYKEAIEVIKLSLEQWPHLKYVEISSDGADPPDEIHDEIFIGGSTSTAIENGLKSWSRADFAKLNSSINLHSFHAAIRRKYGRSLS